MALTTDFIDGQSPVQLLGTNVCYAENVVDFALANLDISADSAKVLKLPMGAKIIDVAVTIVTGQATIVVDLGDSNDADGYISAVAVASAGEMVLDGAFVTGAGLTVVPYAAEDYLVMTADADITTLKVLVSATYTVSDAVKNGVI